MLTSAQKFVVLFVIGLLSFSFLTPFANAQQATIPSTTATSSLNIPVLTQQILMGFLSTATCVVSGVDFMSQSHNCLSYNSKTGTFNSTKDTSGGLLGLAVESSAFTFIQPFHTSDYVRYLSNSWIVKKADAADTGTGFSQLSPITNLWIAFRNLSYLLFVIIFVVIGFAIMLRAKIDPRTVMTIENQIPKLIVALILITFSFAIAGFVLDIMWVGIYLVINIFASLDPTIAHQIGPLTSGVKDNPFGWVNDLNSGPLGFLGIAQQAAGGVKDITNVIVINIFENALGGALKIPFLLLSIIGIPSFISCLITSVFHISLGPISIGQDYGACLDSAAGTIVSSVAGIIAFLVFAIALLVVLIRVWWTLIKSYALFLIFAIFGPIVIMTGVLPGSKTNFEYWLRHLLAYTIVFPTVMGIFLLGKTLMDVYSAQGTAAPPLWGVSGQTVAFLGPLIGFAIMMLAPGALTMVQDALNAPDPKYLAGIGQAIGVGSQGFGGAVGKLWQRSFRESDPLRNLDEGWARKLFLPRGSWQRKILIGRDTNTGLNPNKSAGGH